MNKKLFLILLPALCICLTGCLSVVHVISADGKNRTETFFKLVIEKSLLEMGESLSGEEGDTDYAELLDVDDLEDITGFFHGGYSMEADIIDNDLEFGFWFKVQGKNRTEWNEMSPEPFLPVFSGSSLIIPLSESDETGGEALEDDEFSRAFFSSAKYTLLVDKRVFPTLHRVRVDTGGRECKAHFQELKQQWLIEFPLLYWLSAEGQTLIILD